MVAAAEFLEFFNEHALSMAVPVKEHLQSFYDNLMDFVGEAKAGAPRGRPKRPSTEDAREGFRDVVRRYYESLENEPLKESA